MYIILIGVHINEPWVHTNIYYTYRKPQTIPNYESVHIGNNVMHGFSLRYSK
jgi:hypothetical protein